MFFYVESMLVIILEVLCCRIFYGTFGQKRANLKPWLEPFFLFFLILGFYALSLLSDQIAVFKIIMVTLGMSAAMYRILEISFIKSLILSFFYEGLLFIMDYLTFLFCTAVFGELAEIDSVYAIQGGVFVLLDKVLLLLLVLLFRKAVGDYEISMLKDSDWLKFIFFPIYTIAMIVAMFFVLGAPGTKNTNLIFFVISFGLIGMNMVVFYLILDIMKREKKSYEDRIFRLKMKNQTEMYYSISENYEQQRKRTHEYKNQLFCIKSLLDRNEVKEASHYINQINDAFKTKSDSIHTNHVIVDAILNTKYGEMLEKDIVFVFHINDLSQLMISDEDIVVILSNLLNNAIEACEQCQGKKVIKLKFVIEKDMTVISVKNTYKNELLIQDGMFLTTKNAKDGHGIGISNMVHVIEKYGGSYVIKPEGGEFLFSIMIPRNGKMSI